LLEFVKQSYGHPIDQRGYSEIIDIFEKKLRVLHPFMPFLTEELWHFIKDRKTDEALTLSAWPQTQKFDQKLIADFELAQQIIVGIRNFRNEKNISHKESISLYINKEATDFSFESSIVKLGGLTAINFTCQPDELVGGSFRINNMELFIPTDAAEDTEAEKEKLTLELNYTRGFLASVEKKLSNERFVANAPEKVIALERKKAADAKEKIVLLEKNLALL